MAFFSWNDLHIPYELTQPPREQDLVDLGGVATRCIGYQMAVSLLEQCVDYYQVVGYSKVQNSASLVISLTKAKAAMDFFVAVSRSTNMSIEVTPWRGTSTSLGGILAAIE